MRILACGDRAVLVELGSLEEAMAADRSLRALARTGEGIWGSVRDVVPSARCVLVQGADAGELRAALAAGGLQVGASDRAAGPELELPVRYDGADLGEVARLTGLTVEEVILAHCETPWTVAFGGFAPGFAYLAGGDPRLRVPRLAAPRTRVPAGSVAIADEFSGVYPTASPGGWRLLGRTDAPLFDPTARRPALLTPGATVRFVPVDRRVAVASPRPPSPVSAPTAGPALVVDRTQLPVTIQDEGRPGLGSIGVGISGAADLGAYRLGARLVGNPAGAAALEVTLGGVGLRAEGNLTVALTGAACPASVEGCAVSPGVAFGVRDGERLRIEAPASGLRTYVSVRGGIAVEPVLGSRSRDTLGGLGPAPLTGGEALPVGPARPGFLPGIDWTPVTATDAGVVVLHYLPGPRAGWADGVDGSEWVVGDAVDRVGARLTGGSLRRREGELASEPVVRGAIQVPPSGEPVLFLADHPVTGGYPVVGVLTPAAADSAAQLRPGQRCRLVARVR